MLGSSDCNLTVTRVPQHRACKFARRGAATAAIAVHCPAAFTCPKLWGPNMKLLIKAAIVAAALGASAAASADTFDFSYVFSAGGGSGGQVVTGSFTGTTADGGLSVTNVGDFQVSLNGIAFGPVTVGGTTLGGALQANSWNTTLGAFDDTTPVTIYANGALNNFAISDVDAAVNSNPDYEFAYINDATDMDSEAVAANFLQTDSFSAAEGNPTQLAIDSSPVASSWQLSEVPPSQVTDGPLPLWAIGVLGAVLLGLASRRLRV